MKSKTLIISSKQNQNSRGILTLYIEDQLLKAKLRLYNLGALNNEAKLAVYHQGQVYSANLILKSGCYLSSLVGDFDMDQDFYTAIVDTSLTDPIILCGGTYAGYYFEDNQVFEELYINKKEDVDLYKPTSQPEPQIETNAIEDCDKCLHCKYKEYFYAHQSHEEKDKNDSPPTTPTIPTPKPSVISALVPQFDYIFNNYPQNTELNTLIPNGKFVKIDEGQESYSIGALYNNNQMQYICYAVRSNYNTPPPKELGTHYQWLPIDAYDPLSEGYYLIYQDAQDLKIVEI